MLRILNNLNRSLKVTQRLLFNPLTNYPNKKGLKEKTIITAIYIR
jgi:hypothetical protein